MMQCFNIMAESGRRDVLDELMLTFYQVNSNGRCCKLLSLKRAEAAQPDGQAPC